MKEEKVTVNFKVSADEREYLKTLAAKARISQSELMSRLIADYGEQLVRSLREPTFTPESGLPEEEPIVHVFMDRWVNQPTLTYYGDIRSPMASISELQQYPEWITQKISIAWCIRLREGVFERKSAATAELVSVDEADLPEQ